MSDTQGFATLDADERRRVMAAHPRLKVDFAFTDAVVALVSADDDQEMAALAGGVEAARAAFRSQRESASAVLRALLPPERLALGPSVVTQVQRDAELRAALADEFGLLSGAEVAERAGSRASNARAMASRWSTSGRIFAVPVDQAQRFPGYQFDEEGRPRPVVANVIGRLAPHLTAWELALWFVGANGWLGGERPVDVLASTDEVIQAADKLAEELRADAAAGV